MLVQRIPLAIIGLLKTVAGIWAPQELEFDEEPLPQAEWRYSTSSGEIPSYIVEFAPLVWLHSEETYFPGSIEQYLDHFYVGSRSKNSSAALTPATLVSAANELRSQLLDPKEHVALVAKSQWYENPQWVTAIDDGIPDLSTGNPKNAVATLIVVEKPNNITDAFWFYFYPFNEGPYVMGHGPFGNHLGDWEHSLVRFRNNKPEIFWSSAHGGGSAYWYPKDGENHFHAPHTTNLRPALLAARGTHANYASEGQHPRDAPWHILNDYADRGWLWDPAKNFVAYTADLTTQTIAPANGSIPGREIKWGDWLLFDGLWGNWQLKHSDPRQQWSPWQYRVVDGPSGPLAKNLGRTKVCERHKWWNLNRACLVRKRPSPAEGLDADTRACPLLTRFAPNFLKPTISKLTKHGYLCWFLDELFG